MTVINWDNQNDFTVTSKQYIEGKWITVAGPCICDAEIIGYKGKRIKIKKGQLLAKDENGYPFHYDPKVLTEYRFKPKKRKLQK
jgi:hypothetical protein